MIHGRLRCRYGLVSPQDGLVSPQDGLVSPQDGLVMADLLEKCTFFADFSIRAFKLAAIYEKQLFTFFAFLPPYIGVSGSPMYLKR